MKGELFCLLETLGLPVRFPKNPKTATEQLIRKTQTMKCSLLTFRLCR
jgi:hypothetical protein